MRDVAINAVEAVSRLAEEERRLRQIEIRAEEKLAQLLGDSYDDPETERRRLLRVEVLQWVLGRA